VSLDYRRTCQNGTPHLTYFRADDQLSFNWDGTMSSPIEVEYGGYGEPVIATIEPTDVPALHSGLTLADLFPTFTAVCDEWADSDPRDMPAGDLRPGDHFRRYVSGMAGQVWHLVGDREDLPIGTGITTTLGVAIALDPAETVEVLRRG
jgi:hypothetical protein